VVRIDDELIRYRGVNGAVLAAAERGAYGTTAAAHGPGSAVLLTRFTEELGRWWGGTMFRRVVEHQVPLKDLVNDLREQCLLHVWQTEDAKIAAKCVAPPYWTDTPKELDDESGFLHASTAWDPGSELRVSRITIYYDPVQADPGSHPANYAGALVVLDWETERQNYYGEVRAKEVFGSWIYREHEALLLGSRYLIRYRRGAQTFTFAAELKDDDLAVGDFVRISSRDLIDESGAPRERALFEVTKKQRVTDNRLEFTAVDTRLDRRYPVISPASMTADYDGADEEERERFGWIGDNDNRVGTAGEDGYYIY
jgi:hypothetical protein